MNDNKTTPETTENQIVETVEDATTDSETHSKAGREAAKYRRQLREVEAERDALRGQVEGARDALLAEALSVKIDVSDDPRFSKNIRLDVPTDLFTVGGIDKATMFDQAGNLDREALTEALRVTHEARPSLFGPSGIPQPDYSQGAGRGFPTGPSFEGAFSPRR